MIDKKEIWENIKYIAIGIIFAVALNKGMGLILHTDLPIVAVMSGSMVHDATTPYRHYQFLEENFNYSKEEIDSWQIKNGFRPGDVLIIKGIPQDELKVGDVIVFTYEVQPVPIIHRIIYIDEKGYPFTKGDHNPVMDPDCNLNQGTVCWKRTDIKGKAVLWVPWLGLPKLILFNIIAFLRGG
ncbi:MAG: signal peptidase I [Candidatus Aenigmarchaeota archaeon]|nr:signal peptidase I [Candidatus Aenigmarchaeota archaeon]NCS70773.1 signal peptidase I [Candidatus Aenigmarchaeota archaeon]OIN85918.1 MAG: signal peptidase I [Candidatus Aenigmarchaeota archaeon CG1_02_38_14]